MHRTDYMSHRSFNIVIKNDIRIRQFIIVILNPKKIASSNGKCRSL
jgi:hypothetical protein